MGVNCAAEGDPVAIFFLQAFQIGHAAGGCLHGVEDVHADVNKVLNQVEDIAIRVEENLGVRAFLGEGDQVGVEGLDHLAVHLGGDHQAFLRAEVITDFDNVEIVAGFL